MPSARFWIRNSWAFTPSQKNLVSREDAGLIMASASRSCGTDAVGDWSASAGLNFNDPPVHFGHVFVADLPGDPLADEVALAECGVLGADDVGQLGDDADILAWTQVAVIRLIAVGGDDADKACVVEQFHDRTDGIVAGTVAAEAHHRPHLDHRGRCDDARMACRLGRRLVDVDLILVAHGVDPVPDHRLVHRISTDPRLARSLRP